MAWCPNCDEIRNVASSAACPVCSAATLDAGRLRAPAQPGNVAVLELEPEALPAAPGEPAAFSVRASLSRGKLFASLAIVAVAAGGLGITKLTGATKNPAKTTAAPKASTEPVVETAPTLAPVPQPPFGTPMPGVLTLADEDNITRVNLTTGDVINVPLAEASGWSKALSRDGRSFAYRDDPGMLWVVSNLNGAKPVPLVSDVSSYTFTEDGASMIVARNESVSNNVTRSRIERRAIDFSRTDLLFETNRLVNGFWWRRGTLFVHMSDGKNDGVYEVTGRTKARLIRNKVSVYDVSADGERILVGPEFTTPGLWVVDVATKVAKQIGPKALLVTEAAFSPNGKSIALAGTTDYEINEVCGDGPGCRKEFVANNSILYRTETASTKLQKLFAGNDFGGITWGAGDWVFFMNTGTVTATRGDGGERTLAIWGGSTPSIFVYSA
jgi:hypothetical protein